MTENFAAALASALETSWPALARPNQLPPPGVWSIWLLLAGRGFGKTRTLAEWANAQAVSGQASRLAIVAATAADARDVLVEGESGILACAPAWSRPTYEPSRRRVTWPNGAIATLYSAEEPDRLRGPQHDGEICDELGTWPHETLTWDMLQFGLRLGVSPRAVVATTPRPTKLIRRLVEDPGCVITRGSSSDNRANLAPAFFDSIVRRYEGTRLGRQELDGELLEDVQGALWTRDQLEQCRRERRLAELVRVVVAIDPAATSGEDADETGIVVAGKDAAGHGYIIADVSGRYAPPEWARVAVAAYREYHADRIVAEVNNGGEMVEATLRVIDPNVSYSAVRASRGKVVRAEPVAALYEQQRVHHVGVFPQLEDQLCTFAPGSRGSPDRLDAMVWALTELLVEPMKGWNMFEFYRLEAARLAPKLPVPVMPVYAKGSVEWQRQQAERKSAPSAS
jgi:phage terminase large subunit-like protein